MGIYNGSKQIVDQVCTKVLNILFFFFKLKTGYSEENFKIKILPKFYPNVCIILNIKFQ